ncbi:unnamed protein product [Prunus armeniaca]
MCNMRYPFEALTVSKFRSAKSYVLVTSRGSHWDKNAPSYSAHAPAALGCPKRYRIAGKLPNREPGLLP